jgi:hypothetical protein
MPDLLNMQVLDILRARSSWRGGKVRIGTKEVIDLLAARFPGEPRPSQQMIAAIVQRLVRQRRISWAVTTDGGICYIA